MESEGKEILDLRGALIPVALLKFTKAFREMEPEKTMEILMADDSTRANLLMVLKAFSYEMLANEKVGNIYRMLLRKKG